MGGPYSGSELDRVVSTTCEHGERRAEREQRGAEQSADQTDVGTAAGPLSGRVPATGVVDVVGVGVEQSFLPGIVSFHTQPPSFSISSTSARGSFLRLDICP